MTPLTTMLLSSLLLVIATMTSLWLLSLARRDASIVDPFWGTGFVLVAWFTLLSTSSAQSSFRAWSLAVLTTVWGLRLSLYLLWRNWSRRRLESRVAPAIFRARLNERTKALADVQHWLLQQFP